MSRLVACLCLVSVALTVRPDLHEFAASAKGNGVPQLAPSESMLTRFSPPKHWPLTQGGAASNKPDEQLPRRAALTSPRQDSTTNPPPLTSALSSIFQSSAAAVLALSTAAMPSLDLEREQPKRTGKTGASKVARAKKAEAGGKNKGTQPKAGPQVKKLERKGKSSRESLKKPAEADKGEASPPPPALMKAIDDSDNGGGGDNIGDNTAGGAPPPPALMKAIDDVGAITTSMEVDDDDEDGDASDPNLPHWTSLYLFSEPMYFLWGMILSCFVIKWALGGPCAICPCCC